jgi:hypothetical protein
MISNEYSSIDSSVVPKLYVDTLKGFVLLLHVLEEEVECLRLPHLARGRQFLRQ